MNPFAFALKRFARRPLFIGMLVVYILSVVLAGSIGERIGLPSAGVFDGSKTAESQRILAHLLENGFVEHDNPEDLTELVRSGRLDCAVILPENLVERMTEHDLAESVPWIVSPTSFVPDLYKDHVAAALFREYAPYLALTLFEETAVPQEEVFREYERMFEDGYAFSFDISVTGDRPTPAQPKQNSLVMGASAILLCAVVFAFCAELADSSFRETVGRIGLARAITVIVIPGLVVRMGFAYFAGCIGLLLTKSYDLLVPLLLYTVILTGVGIILSGLLGNVRYIYILLSVLVVGSAALCPIYTDIAMVSPVLSVVRTVFPPYWLWLLPDNRGLGAAAAIAALLGGILTLVVRYAAVERYRLQARRKQS